MKRRIVKTVLPLMAFLLATAFAFATDQKPSGGDAPETLYIFQDEQCTPISYECNNLSKTPCVYLGNQVYRYGSPTTCSVEMFHRP